MKTRSSRAAAVFRPGRISAKCILVGSLLAGPAHAQPYTLEARGVEPTDIEAARGGTGAALVIRALSLRGVDYRLGGNSPKTGLDCSGLVRLVFQETVGLSLPRRSEDMSRTGEPVAPGDLRPGDLVFFNALRHTFSHVGIYIGDRKFIHAPSSGGKVRTEYLDTMYWVNRFDGARRIVSDDWAGPDRGSTSARWSGRPQAPVADLDAGRLGMFGAPSAVNPVFNGQGVAGVYHPGVGRPGVQPRSTLSQAPGHRGGVF